MKIIKNKKHTLLAILTLIVSCNRALPAITYDDASEKLNKILLNTLKLTNAVNVALNTHPDSTKRTLSLTVLLLVNYQLLNPFFSQHPYSKRALEYIILISAHAHYIYKNRAILLNKNNRFKLLRDTACIAGAQFLLPKLLQSCPKCTDLDIHLKNIYNYFTNQ